MNFISDIVAKNYSIIEVSEENINSAQKLYEEYLDYMDGIAPKEKNSENYIERALIYGDLPPNGKRDNFYLKIVVERSSNEIVGLLSFYDGYPEKGIVYIGLFMLSKVVRGRGLGRDVIEKMRTIFLEYGLRSMRVAVDIKNWLGIRFWFSLGFNQLTKISGDKSYSSDTFLHIELERKL